MKDAMMKEFAKIEAAARQAQKAQTLGELQPCMAAINAAVTGLLWLFMKGRKHEGTKETGMGEKGS